MRGKPIEETTHRWRGFSRKAGLTVRGAGVGHDMALARDAWAVSGQRRAVRGGLVPTGALSQGATPKKSRKGNKTKTLVAPACPLRLLQTTPRHQQRPPSVASHSQTDARSLVLAPSSPIAKGTAPAAHFRVVRSFRLVADINTPPPSCGPLGLTILFSSPLLRPVYLGALSSSSSPLLFPPAS
jgi:hypothetical protein